MMRVGQSYPISELQRQRFLRCGHNIRNVKLIHIINQHVVLVGHGYRRFRIPSAALVTSETRSGQLLMELQV